MYFVPTSSPIAYAVEDAPDPQTSFCPSPNFCCGAIRDTCAGSGDDAGTPNDRGFVLRPILPVFCALGIYRLQCKVAQSCHRFQRACFHHKAFLAVKKDRC